MSEGDPDTDDELAAEYVLGVLAPDRRAQVSERLERDVTFARRVSQWQERLGDMNVAYTPQTPPAHIKDAIDQRLFPPLPRRSVWASFAGIVAAGLAVLALIFVLATPAPDTLVANLRADGSGFVVDVEISDGVVTVALRDGEVPAGRALELWQIDGDSAPVSVGLIGNATGRPTTPYAEGQTLAISIEPAGGSPTGAPTGPVVAAGVLKKS